MLDRLRLAWRLWGVYDHAEREGRKTMTGKALISSKQFWWNLIFGALQVADWATGTGMIPPPYGPMIQSIVSILIRTFFTAKPITGIVEPGPVPLGPAAARD